MTYFIDHTKRLTIDDCEKILRDDKAIVKLSASSKTEIIKCRKFLDEKIKQSSVPVYGVNTGFGALCNVIIPENEIELLQENLVKSHACGTGDEVPEEIVKLMLFLKIQALSYGKSGIALTTAQRLCEFINHKIYPVVFTQGSLGASGDLAPLAHLSLPLLGLGNVRHNGKKYSSKEILKKFNLKPIKLQSKEGLALLNGTQFMSAYGVYNIIISKNLNRAADVVSAMSLDAFDCRIEPFKNHLHKIRAHKGQVQTAVNIFDLLIGSEISKQKKTQVQDPYSFRCIPQVHGASRDTIDYIESVFETEINSVTDNPIIFPDENEIVSGGNFHGQPLALASDFLSIAVAELSSISERRIFLLISGQRNLPPFLTKNAGLHSGFMITQYSAASIVSQNKQLCTPASVDSIVSSNGQEDHVSMGANAATKCHQVIENSETVLAIELLCAAQALDFRKPLKSSKKIENTLKKFRKKIPHLSGDEILHDYILSSKKFLKTIRFEIN